MPSRFDIGIPQHCMFAFSLYILSVIMMFILATCTYDLSILYGVT